MIRASTRACALASAGGQPEMSPAAAASDDAADARTVRDHDVEHVGHAEDRCVQERTAACHTARRGRGERIQVRTGLDEHARDVRVAVARGGHEGGLVVTLLAVGGGARRDQRTRNVARGR